MKILYIAGPYRGKTVNEIRVNIRRASDAAAEIWKAGHAAICPHLNSAYFDGVTTDENFLEGYVEILKRCDGMILHGTWNLSAGTMKEIQVCKDNNIPIYVTIRDAIADSPVTGDSIDHMLNVLNSEGV